MKILNINENQSYVNQRIKILLIILKNSQELYSGTLFTKPHVECVMGHKIYTPSRYLALNHKSNWSYLVFYGSYSKIVGGIASK